MNSYSGPEKRKHQRIEVSYSVSYKVKGATDEYNLSRSGNISQGGMVLMSYIPFPQGTILALIIRGPFSLQPVQVSGEVLDSLEVVKNSVYKTRVKFLQLDEEQLTGLDQFIKRINKTPG